jgi:polyisoprenyl-teichoic acid--peptidoglycan teichoic acid transferase
MFVLFIGAIFTVDFTWKIISATRITEYVSRAEAFNINKRMNILLLAVDVPTLQEPSRADIIKVVSLDPKKYIMNMMTIPRDSYVAPAGFLPEHKTKINGINNPLANPKHYKTEKLVETVEEIMGIKIHGYVKINFNGFIDVIDSIGGIDFYVESDMKVTKRDYSINLKKGFQHFDGIQALKYVRYREDADWCYRNDSRSARQTKFIKGIIKELAKPSNWGKLPSAIKAVMKNIETDIPTEEIFSFAGILRHFNSESIKDILFPGTFGEAPGVRYEKGIRIEFLQDIVEVDLVKLKKLGQEYFSEKESTKEILDNSNLESKSFPQRILVDNESLRREKTTA